MDINVNNNIEKPILLLREEFLFSISNLINDSKLPLFAIEPILRDVLDSVNVELKKQYQYEKEYYENALKASTQELQV